jgi:hypothetical protein
MASIVPQKKMKDYEVEGQAAGGAGAGAGPGPDTKKAKFKDYEGMVYACKGLLVSWSTIVLGGGCTCGCGCGYYLDKHDDSL